MKKKKPILTRQRGVLAVGVLLAAGGVVMAVRHQSVPEVTAIPAADRTERKDKERQGALKTLPALADKPSREELGQEAAERASENPETAVAWAESLAEPGDRETAVAAVASELARTEPLQALELALHLPASSTRNEVLERATRQWASRDPLAAVEWADAFPDQTLRPKLLGGAVLEWSQKEPREAAAKAVDSLEPGRPMEDLIVGIVQRWVQTDPVEATAWVADFPEGPLKEAAEANLAAIQAAKAAQAEEHE